MAQYIKTEDGYKGLEESISAVTDGKMYSKMDKTNPTGTGSFSMNRKAGTVIGKNSHAEGDDTTASGYSSHAEGIDTTASGYSSHAEGNYTDASGDYSHAEGGSNKASGKYSHAEGNGTKASGYNSHAEGYQTTASEQGSHAEGYSTNRFSSVVTTTNPTTDSIITAWKTKKFSVAKGDYSHVEGKDNLALGKDSHAEGGSTEASGDHSHTEGANTTASGLCSHAEGNITTASGTGSHVEGGSTKASGDYSHAEGIGTEASGDNSHVQGKFNIEDTSSIYADIIGNGTSDTARSNAATVDWNGNVWFAGDVYTGSTSGTNKDEGSKKLATEEYVNSSIAAGRSDISLGLTSASVGQIIKVKAVDESGKPTAWEAVNDKLPNPTPSDVQNVLSVDQIGEFEYGYAFKPMPNINEFISLGLTSASIGQIIKVKYVDDTGKPTAWEAVDIPNAVTDDHINSLIDAKLRTFQAP